MKNIILIFITLTVITSAQSNNPEITSKEIKDHITYLASDELEGRMTGTKALYTAAEFLKNEFESYGIKPLFERSYFQEFPFIEKLELGNNNSVSIIFNDGSSTKIEELVLDVDYTPLAFTDNLSY